MPPGGYAEAYTLVQRLTSKVDVGDVTSGRVVGVKDFGYVVEVGRARRGTQGCPRHSRRRPQFGFNKEGLLHISELTHKRVENPLELLAAGDYIELKCIGKDHVGRVRASTAQALSPCLRSPCYPPPCPDWGLCPPPPVRRLQHKMSRKALLPHPDDGGSGTDVGDVRKLPTATIDTEGDEGASDSE